MLNTCLLGSVGACLAYDDFVSPVRRVDEGDIGAGEELVQKGNESLFGLCEITLDQFNIGQLGQLLCDKPVAVPDLRLDVPSNSRGDADERSGLTAGRVDGHDGAGWL